MGRKSKRKGYRGEYQLVRRLKEAGLDAKRVPLSGQADLIKADVVVEGLVGEVKLRKDGFRQIYKWLEGRDLLFLKANRRPWLVVMRLEEFVRRRERNLSKPVLILFSEAKRKKPAKQILSLLENGGILSFAVFEGEHYVKAFVVDSQVGGTLIIELHSYGLMLTPLGTANPETIRCIADLIKSSYDPQAKVLSLEDEIVEALMKLDKEGREHDTTG